MITALIILIALLVVGLVLIFSGEPETNQTEASDILEERMRLDGLAMQAVRNDNNNLYTRVQAARDALNAAVEPTRPWANDDSSRWINKAGYEKERNAQWLEGSGNERTKL
jgi:hypothetical protein